jgi:hypothetical protein
MAKITKEVIPAVYTYTLVLSQEEASTLLALTEKIGGSPTASRRKHTDAIRFALLSTGLTANISDLLDRYKGTLYFEEVIGAE